MVTHARAGNEEEAQVLWAPWRMRYIEAEKPGGCIFCQPTEESALRERLILATTSHARVMLNKYPYTSGHLLIAPHLHTATLADLSTAVFLDLMELVRRAVSVVETVLRPHGVNVGLNLGTAAGAGIADHLHWHVVPRWVGDTNFMPVVGAVRVMPQHLLDTYDRLRPDWLSASCPTEKDSAPKR